MDPVLMDVADRLGTRISDLRWREEDLPLLRRNFDAHSSIDYDAFAETFTHRFLLANYWKTIIALRDADLPGPETIVDLGAGSGAATAAALAWMHSGGILPPRVRVVMIDRSARQLAIARDLIADVAQLLPGLSIDLSVLEAAIGPDEAAWRQAASGADLILASHLLTENLEQAPALVEALVGSAAPGARLLVTERPDDDVWLGLPARGRRLQMSSEDLPLNGFVAQSDSRWLSVRYCQIPVGGSTLRDLVGRYFRAWREQSVEQLDEVFAADATYQEDPFSEPIRSLDGIRGYWMRRVLPQVDPRPSVLKIAVDQGRAFVEWEADLTVDLEHKLVSGVMELELDACGQRIGCLRECYSSRILA